MASQSQGIHHLLQAEKKAKEKLDEAKKRKGKRLKQAKDEAMAEIERYRLKRENEYKKKQTDTMGSHGNLSVQIEEQTKIKHQALKRDFQQNKDAVLKKLLDLVCDIKPEVHANYRA
ncbi:V-type proton ATPase subunit G 3-like [Protopterus annectens]|uniref:V-type proton ATPase subunit G 3-like n=1 Tax=Protopterus annectens TaxID=7888 RepID=UPI001CFBF177|nr:V-type proton ATPase subunit G 3-like [Protopterus annectens]